MTFTAGKSGNPSGRPKGFAGVAARIMAETGDGEELVTWALAVWRNTSGQRTFAEQAAAHAWLSDRALGKPLQSNAVTALVGNVQLDRPPANWRDMSQEERRAAVAAHVAGAGLTAAGAGDLALLLPAPSDE